jgi:hypothetical protein
MGTPAEEVQNEIEETEVDANLEVEETEGTNIEAEAELDGDGNPIVIEEPEEIEIVREGTQPKFNQQEVNDIVSKRVNKLNAKVTEASESAGQINTELALANERNKILQLALEQAKAVPQETSLPMPDDFDEGVSDPEYIKKQAEYTQALINKGIAEGLAQVTQANSNTHNQQQVNDKLLSKQVKHYERAEKIGAKDYAVTEDKALEVLGNEVANHIIDNFDDSHVILYYLGKNPDEAERIAGLIKSQPIKGVAEMGRLSAELKVKTKSRVAPDPDEEIQGGIASSKKKRKGPTFE